MSFVNYFDSAERPSPLNLAVARTVLAAYLVWKTIWYDWQLWYEAPYVVHEKFAFVVPPSPWVLVAEKWLLVLALVAFAVGYRLGLSSFASAVLVAHLASVRYLHNSSGGTTALFIAAYFLVFFGLYREEDELSVDGLRRLRDVSIDRINRILQSGPTRPHAATALKWNLVIFALVYFGAGVDKLVADPGLGFATAENLSRIIVFRHAVQSLPLDVGLLLVEYPPLVTAAALGTLVLEVGLLPAVLAGVTVTPLLLGVVGMTTSIALVLGILFGDVYAFVGLFVAWDTLDERLTPDRTIDLVYDDQCALCVRSLYPFALLDVNDSVTFVPATEAPAAYRGREGVTFQNAMYVFDGEEAYAGYHAFRELFAQFGLFRPVAWVMGRAPVARVGEPVYQYVAANRSRRFTCRVDIAFDGKASDD